MGAATKTAAAFASFIGLTAISLFGFNPTLEAGLAPSEGGNTNLALLGIVLLYTAIPCCFYLATLPWVWSYTLTEERQARIRARLDRKAIDQNQITTSNPETKAAIFTSKIDNDGEHDRNETKES